MKYLLEAIDARQGRFKPSKAQLGRAGAPRRRPDPIELKRVIVEASEGLDDKSSATEFVDTLERIVNEIRNTTEHSGAFLQKVRKTDVPDYYDVIKRPMDLATLLKRVKQQTYRTKKAFAEDLDLIWSNCLLYNSHPSHPLRRSAEILRQKSNQLLEFISDPTLPAKSMFAASLTQDGRGRSASNRGTPGIVVDGDDEIEGDAESDQEMAAGLRAVQQARLWTPGCEIASAVPNGLNGYRHGRSQSPLTPRAGTPTGGRGLSRKASRIISRASSPSSQMPADQDIPFEEQPAILRTADLMGDFLRLDEELERLEAEMGWNPRLEKAPRPLLPLAALSPQDRIDGAVAADSEQSLMLELVQSLKPAKSLAVNGQNGSVGTPQSFADTVDSPAPSGTSLLPLAGDELPDELWWKVLGPMGQSAPVASTSQQIPAGLAAGIPRTPWNGSEARLSKRRKPKDKSANGSISKMSRAKQPRSRKAKEQAWSRQVPGLGGKMRHNFELLRDIRRLHGQLERSSWSSDGPDAQLPLISDDDNTFEDVRPAWPAAYLATGIPKAAFRSHMAPRVAQDSMAMVSRRVLGHSGFESASQSAVDVLAHVAAEYMTNLGRTLRFYSDRYGDRMSTAEILSHVLGENGVPAPSVLEQYVAEDVERYGTKLADMHTKLSRARREQVEGFEDAAEGKDDELLAQDGEVLAAGDFGTVLGLDYFGVSNELGTSTLSVPLRLYRGEPGGGASDSTRTVTDLAYPPPPPFPRLTSAAIPAQIGLLQPYFLLRQDTEHGLVDDFAAPTSSTSLAILGSGSGKTKGLQRAKVPPSGRIPVKGSKRRSAAAAAALAAAAAAGEDPDAVLAALPRKKRKKAFVTHSNGEEE